MRGLGLDVGERRIGVSLSDPEGILAMPLTVVDVRTEEEALERNAALAREHEVDRVVVGLPLSMDGSMGLQAQRVTAFAETLAERMEIPVDTWDERLSTVAAGRALTEAGVKRGKKRKRLDSAAACIILQGYLDRSRSGR
jgi:putative Holliday junction resolvase